MLGGDFRNPNTFGIPHMSLRSGGFVPIKGYVTPYGIERAKVTLIIIFSYGDGACR